MCPDTCQAGVDVMTNTIFRNWEMCFSFNYDRNSSDPRLLLNMCRGLISDLYICMHVYCDILSKHALFCRSCVLPGHFRCSSQKQKKLGILWFLPRIKECRRTAKRLHLTSANNLISNTLRLSFKTI